MKFSEYNYFQEYNDKIICYNGISRKMITLAKPEYKLIFESEIKDVVIKFPSISNIFKQWNFFIDDSFDELSLMRFKNKEKLFLEKKLWVTIIPTLMCNFKYWYCSTELTNTVYDKESMSKELQMNIIKFISNQVERRNANSIHLDWFGGEPTLYFDEIVFKLSKQVLKIANKHKLPFTNHITTNGFLINKDMVTKFKEINLNSFQITIDGNKKKHNSVRNENGKPSFDRIIENIKLIVNEISNINMVLRINYDKQTLKDANQIFNKFSKEEASRIRIDFQRVWQVSKTDQEENTLLKESIKKANNSGFYSSYYGFAPRDFHVCYADRLDYYAINYNGKVYKCTARGYKEDQCIGKIIDNGKLELNYNTLYNYYAKPTFENEHCLNCKLLPLCFGPCIQKNKEYYNQELDFKTVCMYSGTEISLGTHLINEAKNRNLI